MGNYEHFDQLMLADNSGLTVEQQQFKDLHERICYNARKSAEHWVEMAGAIREMRDSKRYKAAGFEDFADYTVNALGIKERQAYNYISVIEKLPETFIKAHATIGVTKLALLTSVNEEEREEILEKIDLDTAKTAEINAAVKAAILFFLCQFFLLRRFFQICLRLTTLFLNFFVDDGDCLFNRLFHG